MREPVVHFHSHKVFHHGKILQFIYPFTCWWTSGLFLIFIFSLLILVFESTLYWPHQINRRVSLLLSSEEFEQDWNNLFLECLVEILGKTKYYWCFIHFLYFLMVIGPFGFSASSQVSFGTFCC